MKLWPKPYSIVIAALITGAITGAITGTTAFAVSNWTAGAGDWNNAGNWDNGVPTVATHPTEINNGGHATISGNVPQWGSVRLGHTTVTPGGSGTLTHAAGVNSTTFYLHAGASTGGTGTSEGTFNMTGGTLTVPRLYVVGTVSAGTTPTGNLNLSDGTINTGGETRFGLGAGVIANVNITGGTFNSGGETRFGFNGATADVNITGGTFNSSGATRFGNGGGTANVTQSGGTLNSAGYLAFHTQGGGDVTYDMSGDAQLNGNGEFNIGAQTGGTAILSIDDSAQVSAGSITRVARAGGAIGIVNQVGADTVLTTPTLLIGENTGANGTFNLNDGTLKANTITIGPGNGTFNWGSGTIESRLINTATTITYNGDLTTGHAGDVNASSTLNLGNLGFSGSVIYDDLVVNGDLNLTSSNDTLDFWDNIALLRPSGGGNVITGEIELINVTGTISGQFNNVFGPGPDARRFNFSSTIPGGSSADDLGKNSGYLDYRANGIYFVYKVSGTVPEPGTAGLLLIGTFLIRGFHRCRPTEAKSRSHA